jgi:hypothetical protein
MPSGIIDFTKPMAKCDRCGKLITLAPESSRHEDAHPFRLAKEAKGVCANCVMTQFLYNTYPINMQIDDSGPELLLNPAIREAFIRCGLLAHSDLNIDEVEWSEVVRHWKLPVKIQKSGMNPYRMGESPRARSRNAGLPPASYWPGPAPLDHFAEIGKEQYCPKCGKAAGPTRDNPLEEGTGFIGGGYMTDCQACGFKDAAAIWIRDLAPEKGKAAETVFLTKPPGGVKETIQ